MTPRELLNDVLLRFQVMYLAAALQESLLKQALSTYQTIVGPTDGLHIADATLPVPKPARFSAVSACLDSQGRWHEVDDTGDNLLIVTTAKSVKPFKLHYFVDLRNMNIDADALPDNSLVMLTDYLYALLAIPNTQRAREAMLVTGIQMDLPDDAMLNERKNQLELEMDETAVIIPMVTVY